MLKTDNNLPEKDKQAFEKWWNNIIVNIGEDDWQTRSNHRPHLTAFGAGLWALWARLVSFIRFGAARIGSK